MRQGESSGVSSVGALPQDLTRQAVPVGAKAGGEHGGRQLIGRDSGLFPQRTAFFGAGGRLGVVQDTECGSTRFATRVPSSRACGSPRTAAANAGSGAPSAGSRLSVVRTASRRSRVAAALMMPPWRTCLVHSCSTGWAVTTSCCASQCHNAARSSADRARFAARSSNGPMIEVTTARVSWPVASLSTWSRAARAMVVWTPGRCSDVSEDVPERNRTTGSVSAHRPWRPLPTWG